jgi:hypothetical protein
LSHVVFNVAIGLLLTLGVVLSLWPARTRFAEAWNAVVWLVIALLWSFILFVEPTVVRPELVLAVAMLLSLRAISFVATR